jgi:arginine-tRNA-protein transferase
MKYKAKYHPSELLDPETNDWYSFADVCNPLLDQYKYAVFSDPAKSSSPITKSDSTDSSSTGTKATPDDALPSGWMDPTSIRKKDLEQVLIIAGKSQVVPVTMLVKFDESEEFKNEIKEYVASLGLDLAHQLIVA